MRTRRWKEVFEGSQRAAVAASSQAGGTPWHTLLLPGTPQSLVVSATAATLVHIIGHNGAGEQEASCFVDGKPVARSVMEVGATLDGTCVCVDQQSCPVPTASGLAGASAPCCTS